ncbi:hypothetical protein LMG22037_05503 [Paraburkholderia phenoliruptrix]|uniref:Uncharacterized protein n=1 Tax=Paraburkholderia phenoliruptrix TaxID=252970 RepID=A0A6J5CB42_9BURK|nr:hypothetical protein LMG22037_05503 [Paraburkholderia phenoliruptrix]
MKAFIFASMVALLATLLCVTVIDFIQWYSAMGIVR